MEINLDFGFWSFLVGMSWAVNFFLFAFFIPYKKYFVAKKLFEPSMIAVFCMTFVNAFGLLAYSLIEAYSAGFFVGYYFTLLATLLSYLILRFVVRPQRLKKKRDGYTNVLDETETETSRNAECTTKNVYCIAMFFNLLFFVVILFLTQNFFNKHAVIYQDNDNRLMITEIPNAPCIIQYKKCAEVYYFEKNRVAVKTVESADIKTDKETFESVARDKNIRFKYISYEEAIKRLKKD